MKVFFIFDFYKRLGIVLVIRVCEPNALDMWVLHMYCFFMYMWKFCNDLEKCFLILHRFLQGCCAVTGCTLSHDVGPEKMPTCKYFLEGCCVRDSCPYLHVKVNEKAAICKNFLRGYCPDGQKVSKTISYLNCIFITVWHLQVASLYLS